MQLTSQLLDRLSESATLAMARKSRELAAKGADVISLSLGEPDFDTPDFIKEAARRAIEQNFTHYPPVNGYEEVRNAISKKFLRDNGLEYSPNQIVISTGAKQSIINVLLSLLNPGDEVILPAPYWVSYIEMVKLAGAKPVVIPSSIETDYKITPDQLEEAITPKSRIFLFSSPCNPSGAVYTKDELNKLASVLAKKEDLITISDEIYEHINYGEGHQSIAGYPGMLEKTVTVNGVSKAFAMTGWRIGYIGAPEWIAKACTKLQGQFTSGANTIAQKAAQAAVEEDPSVTESMRNAFLSRRDLLIEKLEQIPGLRVNRPGGAFYLFPDVKNYLGKSIGDRRIDTAGDLCEYLLEEAHVALVDGDSFGTPGCMRISYAASESDLVRAADRLKEALTPLANG